MSTQLNKRERRAAQLLAHYETCERLGAYLGMKNPDGKKISVALWKAERIAHDMAEKACSEPVTDAEVMEAHSRSMAIVKLALGAFPPGFFVNGDPRGYALKIDSEQPDGQALIEAVKLHTDMGGYGILSPEIDGN